MKLSKLQQPQPTTLPIEFEDGDRLTIVYDRSLLTQTFAQTTRPILDKVCDVLISWDVTDDDGGPIGAGPKANGHRSDAWKQILEPLPAHVTARIYRAIWDDVWAGPKAAPGSTAT
jgi:hypothetical protein